MSIQNILRERQIQYLCHFTRLENLESILTHGLIPRSDLYNPVFNPNRDLRVSGLFNDTVRADNHPDATCLSISFPNSRMFSALRHECINGKWIEKQGIYWAVIVLKSDVLLKKDCAFYPINAADSDVNSEEADNFKSLDSFRQMFEGSNKEREFLLPKDPTNVQAEVLVFDCVESSYILGAVLMSDEDVNYFKEKFSKLTFFKHRYWDVFSDRYCARINGFKGY